MLCTSGWCLQNNTLHSADHSLFSTCPPDLHLSLMSSWCQVESVDHRMDTCCTWQTKWFRLLLGHWWCKVYRSSKQRVACRAKNGWWWVPLVYWQSLFSPARTHCDYCRLIVELFSFPFVLVILYKITEKKWLALCETLVLFVYCVHCNFESFIVSICYYYYFYILLIIMNYFAFPCVSVLIFVLCWYNTCNKPISLDWFLWGSIKAYFITEKKLNWLG